MKNKSIPFINNIKFLASFFVIALHFMLNLQGQIPNEQFTPKVSLFFSIIYQLFITCVPLFIITTGFLSLKQNYSKKLFKRLIKFFTLYILSSLLSYSIIHFTLGTTLTIHEIIQKIMYFNLITYSWYVEMYIGLVLLIPILNKVVTHSTKKELQLFIGMLFLTVALPSLINAVPQLQPWIHLANFWINIYPILYYFIGAYIKKYVDFSNFSKKRISFILISLFIIIILGVLINYFNANPRISEKSGSYPSLLIVIQSILTFTLIASLFNKQYLLIDKISRITLPIYLMSYSVDQIFYPYILKKLDSPKTLIYFYPAVVVTIFIISIVLAALINKINNLMWKILSKLHLRK